MKHWHGVAAALFVALVCLIVDQLPETVVNKERALFGLFAILLATLAEVLWLILLDLRETKSARTEASEANQKTKTVLEQIQTRYGELVTKVSERMERDESLFEVIGHQRPGLSHEEMRTQWLYLLNRLRKTYDATNYIRDIYSKNWAQAALHVQIAKKAEEDITIRKVFLFDSEEELIESARYIEEQEQIGVQTWYLLQSVLKASPLGKRIHEYDVPSVDFGIFDGEKVLVWELDVQRAVTGGRFLFGSDHVGRHQTFFDGLCKLGREFTIQRFSTVPVKPTAVKSYARVVDTWRTEDGGGYSGEYANVDYALRLSGGWLTQFGLKAESTVLAAFLAGKHAGFSILTGESAKDKEFYVAVHPRHLGAGIGWRLTANTIAYGFNQLHLSRIHLKVRPEPAHRVKLYEKAGFRKFGGILTEETNGILTQFLQMEITRAHFDALRESSSK